MDYVHVIVAVELTRYFYVAWLATRRVPVNKVDPIPHLVNSHMVMVVAKAIGLHELKGLRTLEA